MARASLSWDRGRRVPLQQVPVPDSRPTRWARRRSGPVDRLGGRALRQPDGRGCRLHLGGAVRHRDRREDRRRGGRGDRDSRRLPAHHDRRGRGEHHASRRSGEPRPRLQFSGPSQQGLRLMHGSLRVTSRSTRRNRSAPWIPRGRASTGSSGRPGGVSDSPPTSATPPSVTRSLSPAGLRSASGGRRTPRAAVPQRDGGRHAGRLGDHRDRHLRARRSTSRTSSPRAVPVAATS